MRNPENDRGEERKYESGAKVVENNVHEDPQVSKFQSFKEKPVSGQCSIFETL